LSCERLKFSTIFQYNKFVPFITFFVPHIEFEVQIFKKVNITFLKFHKEKLMRQAIGQNFDPKNSGKSTGAGIFEYTGEGVFNSKSEN